MNTQTNSTLYVFYCPQCRHPCFITNRISYELVVCDICSAVFRPSDFVSKVKISSSCMTFHWFYRLFQDRNLFLSALETHKKSITVEFIKMKTGKHLTPDQLVPKHCQLFWNVWNYYRSRKFSIKNTRN